jgi:hypothetical protein
VKRYLWFIAAALVVLIAAACRMGPAAAGPSPTPTSAPATAPLTVWVTLVRDAGQPTPTVPGGATPPPTAHPLYPPHTPPVPGVRVQVLTADPPHRQVGEQRTDAQGKASFSLPPGAYWVLTPWDDRKAIFECGGFGCGSAGALDGKMALAWHEVTISGTGPTEVDLTVHVTGM